MVIRWQMHSIRSEDCVCVCVWQFFIVVSHGEHLSPLLEGGSCYARGLSWLTRRIGQAAWVGYPWVYPMYRVPCTGCLSPAQDLTSWAGYPTLSHTQDWTGCMSWVPCTSYLCSCTGFDRLGWVPYTFSCAGFDRLGWVPYTFSCTGFDRLHETGTLH